MRTLLCMVALAACKSSTPSTASAPPAAGVPSPMCVGQGAAPPADTPPSGPMELQLAPGFLDKMAACRSSEATVPVELVDNEAGTVNAKGDCVFHNGVVCHFHLGVEFVDSNAPRPNLAELHCIFPVADHPKSPNVFGTRFTCKPSITLPGHTDNVQEGAACGAGLLGHLAGMTAGCDARCCEAGTLTDTTEARRKTDSLDVRPNFRICSAPAELDCAALATLSGHSANAPVFGPPIETAH